MLLTSVATTVHRASQLPVDGFNKRFGRQVKPGEIWYVHESTSTYRWDGKAWTNQGSIVYPRPSDGKPIWKWP